VTALASVGARRTVALSAALVLCGALALLPAEAGPLAARAALAALVVAALAALVRRREGARPAPALRVAARAGLTRAAGVAVVEVDGRRLLLGVSERAVELLCELDPPPGRRP
jgi:flagellar protein FliO/FliZ